MKEKKLLILLWWESDISLPEAFGPFSSNEEAWDWVAKKGLDSARVMIREVKEPD